MKKTADRPHTAKSRTTRRVSYSDDEDDDDDDSPLLQPSNLPDRSMQRTAQPSTANNVRLRRTAANNPEQQIQHQCEVCDDKLEAPLPSPPTPPPPPLTYSNPDPQINPEEIHTPIQSPVHMPVHEEFGSNSHAHSSSGRSPHETDSDSSDSRRTPLPPVTTRFKYNQPIEKIPSSIPKAPQTPPPQRTEKQYRAHHGNAVGFGPSYISTQQRVSSSGSDSDSMNEVLEQINQASKPDTVASSAATRKSNGSKACTNDSSSDSRSSGDEGIRSRPTRGGSSSNGESGRDSDDDRRGTDHSKGRKNDISKSRTVYRGQGASRNGYGLNAGKSTIKRVAGNDVCKVSGIPNSREVYRSQGVTQKNDYDGSTGMRDDKHVNGYGASRSGYAGNAGKKKNRRVVGQDIDRIGGGTFKNRGQDAVANGYVSRDIVKSSGKQPPSGRSKYGGSKHPERTEQSNPSKPSDVPEPYFRSKSYDRNKYEDRTNEISNSILPKDHDRLNGSKSKSNSLLDPVVNRCESSGTKANNRVKTSGNMLKPCATQPQRSDRPYGSKAESRYGKAKRSESETKGGRSVSQSQPNDRSHISTGESRGVKVRMSEQGTGGSKLIPNDSEHRGAKVIPNESELRWKGKINGTAKPRGRKPKQIDLAKPNDKGKSINPTEDIRVGSSHDITKQNGTEIIPCETSRKNKVKLIKRKPRTNDAVVSDIPHSSTAEANDDRVEPSGTNHIGNTAAQPNKDTEPGFSKQNGIRFEPSCTKPTSSRVAPVDESNRCRTQGIKPESRATTEIAGQPRYHSHSIGGPSMEISPSGNGSTAHVGINSLISAPLGGLQSINMSSNVDVSAYVSGIAARNEEGDKNVVANLFGGVFRPNSVGVSNENERGNVHLHENHENIINHGQPQAGTSHVGPNSGALPYVTPVRTDEFPSLAAASSFISPLATALPSHPDFALTPNSDQLMMQALQTAPFEPRNSLPSELGDLAHRASESPSAFMNLDLPSFPVHQPNSSVSNERAQQNSDMSLKMIMNGFGNCPSLSPGKSVNIFTPPSTELNRPVVNQLKTDNQPGKPGELDRLNTSSNDVRLLNDGENRTLSANNVSVDDMQKSAKDETNSSVDCRKGDNPTIERREEATREPTPPKTPSITPPKTTPILTTPKQPTSSKPNRTPTKTNETPTMANKTPLKTVTSEESRRPQGTLKRPRDEPVINELQKGSRSTGHESHPNGKNTHKKANAAIEKLASDLSGPIPKVSDLNASKSSPNVPENISGRPQQQHKSHNHSSCSNGSSNSASRVCMKQSKRYGAAPSRKNQPIALMPPQLAASSRLRQSQARSAEAPISTLNVSAETVPLSQGSPPVPSNVFDDSLNNNLQTTKSGVLKPCAAKIAETKPVGLSRITVGFSNTSIANQVKVSKALASATGYKKKPNEVANHVNEKKSQPENEELLESTAIPVVQSDRPLASIGKASSKLNHGDRSSKKKENIDLIEEMVNELADQATECWTRGTYPFELIIQPPHDAKLLNLHLRTDLGTFGDDTAAPHMIESVNNGRTVNISTAFPQTVAPVWDCYKEEHSNKAIPIEDIFDMCSKSSNSKMFIYDGQDFDFHDEILARFFPVLTAEISQFFSRDSRPISQRKIRIWDLKSHDLIRFRFSPSFFNLGRFLTSCPRFKVFNPKFVQSVLQNQSINLPRSIPIRRPEEPPEFKTLRRTDQQSKGLRALRNMVMKIRQLRVVELPECDNSVPLWNTTTYRYEKFMKFPSRSSLTIYLMRNPQLQVDCGQGVLNNLEKRTGFHLIPIYLNCPVKYSSIWDTLKKNSLVKPDDMEIDGDVTISELLQESSELLLYCGQNLPEYQTISKFIDQHRRTGSFPYRYMLAHCGMHVQQHVYDEQWVPYYIDPQVRPCKFATFWNRSSQAVQTFPDQSYDVSVEQILEKNEGELEAYNGQDLPTEVRDELDTWFATLRYKPGFAGPRQISMLLRPPTIPSAKFTLPLCTSVNVKRLIGIEAHPEELHKRRRIAPSQPNRFSILGGKTERETILEADLDITNKPVIGIPFVSCESTTSRGSESEGKQASQTEGSSVDDVVVDGDVDMAEVELAPDDDPVKLAKRTVKKMLSTITEAGPKILRQELAVDLRQQLREELLVEFQSTDDLMNFADQLDKAEIASIAYDLFETLHMQDVYSCLDTDDEDGTADLTTLETEILSGEVCTINGVIDRFREILFEIIAAYSECAISVEAAYILSAGERIWEVFSSDHRGTIELETKMLRVYTICERGQTIGFKKGSERRRTNAVERLKVSEKGSLHVSGTEPVVTYMNYRDEKGHSVMGKKQSVRVMGMSIDSRECERRTGQVYECHVCYKVVSDASGEMLKCSNNAFGFCNRVICQQCYDTVGNDSDCEDFAQIRYRERWFCIHCQGECSKCSGCHDEPIENDVWKHKSRKMQLWWTVDSSGISDVRLYITRRQLNGSYDGAAEEEIALKREKDGKTWSFRKRMRLGAYRCRVFVDGTDFAGTTFQVFQSKPSTEGSKKTRKAKDGRVSKKVLSKGRTKELLGHAWVVEQRKHGPRRIQWEMSSNSHLGSCHVGAEALRIEKSHSFGEYDGGKLIEHCSRTEGYDWRRAKFHPVSTWIPSVVGDGGGKGEVEVSCTSKANRSVRVLYSANDWVSEAVLQRDSPKLEVGRTQREFEIEWNTWMYKQMRESVWGIVTSRSKIHGIGIFTMTGYERGDMVIEYAGSVIRTPLGDIREKEYQSCGLGTYLFKLNEDEIVDATVVSNRARFTNHSCDPNMIADVITIEGRELVVLRAIRRIPKYAELTFDYKLPYEEDEEKLPCLCNAIRCAGVMN